MIGNTACIKGLFLRTCDDCRIFPLRNDFIRLFRRASQCIGKQFASRLLQRLRDSYRICFVRREIGAQFLPAFERFYARYQKAHRGRKRLTYLIAYKKPSLMLGFFSLSSQSACLRFVLLRNKVQRFRHAIAFIDGVRRHKFFHRHLHVL